MRNLIKIALCAVLLIATVGAAPTMVAAGDCDENDDPGDLPTAPSDDSGCEDDHDSRTAQTPTTSAPPSDGGHYGVDEAAADAAKAAANVAGEAGKAAVDAVHSAGEAAWNEMKDRASTDAAAHARGMSASAGAGGPPDEGPTNDEVALEEY